MSVRVKNWAKFQHFKDRKPPWIKLYREILDDPDWFALDAESSKALVMFWLLASESDGYLPDIKKISFRLRISEQKVKSLISNLSHWLEQDDIEVISEGHQVDAPETETETETEARKKPALPDWLPLESWNGWIASRKKKPTARALNLAIAKLESFRAKGIDPAAVLDASTLGGWTGLYEPKDAPKPARLGGLSLY